MLNPCHDQLMLHPARAGSWSRRLLALCFVIQLSGAFHLASDLIDPGADHCQAGCEDERTGKECPPLCGTCSCTHLARPIVTPEACSELRALVSGAGETDYVPPLHANRTPSGLFRPPKA